MKNFKEIALMGAFLAAMIIGFGAYQNYKYEEVIKNSERQERVTVLEKNKEFFSREVVVLLSNGETKKYRKGKKNRNAVRKGDDFLLTEKYLIREKWFGLSYRFVRLI